MRAALANLPRSSLICIDFVGITERFQRDFAAIS